VSDLTKEDISVCPECTWTDLTKVFRLKENFHCPNCGFLERIAVENARPCNWKPSASVLWFYEENGPSVYNQEAENQALQGDNRE